MMFWGKIIGVGLGLAISHNSPLGALAGLIVGHWVDLRLSKQSGAEQIRGAWRAVRSIRRRKKEQLFTLAVVSLAAKLAKCDGQISSKEIAAFKTAFSVTKEQTALLAKIFNHAKEAPNDYERYARMLADEFHDAPLMLSEVLRVLHFVAVSDGDLHLEERKFLNRVAQIFGMGSHVFDHVPGAASEGASDPYQILGVSRNAPTAEIKAAWRKLTREYHPDAVIARGVPKEVVEQAARRMADINAAWDRVCQERGEV